eukprot:233861-Rhodomonas_salina.1
MLRRATTFEFAPEQGIAAVAWRLTLEQKESELHAKVHAGASEAVYAEGEAEFFEHVSYVLNLAAKYGTDAERYRMQRNDQREAWPEVWASFRRLLRSATRHLQNAGFVYHLQMEDLMTTTLGVGFSPTQLSTLRNSCNLSKELGMNMGEARSGAGLGYGLNSG